MRRRVISVTRRSIDFLFNREETVVTTERLHIQSSVVERIIDRVFPVDDTELQLPPSDESKVGQD